MSNTISDNLIRLSSAKTAIAQAIVNKGGIVGQNDGFEDFPNDISTITNSYSDSDEGKVVQNSTLVAQTSRTVTNNGTYNTTTNNSVTVNVPFNGG